MGTYKKGILGAFSGTVGPVVGSTFRGKDVMRSRPRKSSKLPSELQYEQRAKFSKTIKFLTPAKYLLSNYFGSPTGAKSRFNLALSYHIMNAVSYLAGEAVIDYNKVIYAKGSLLNPQNLNCDAIPDAKLKLNWIDNSTQADTKETDQMIVVIFEPVLEEYEFFLNVATRIDATVDLTLPSYLIDKTVEVYAFMVAADGKINSTSQHLGSFDVV